MSRKFITDKENAFIGLINKELVQMVVGQEILYYAISLESTNVDDLYNEAVKKTWMRPVLINARVLWDNPTSSTGEIGVDSKYTAEVYFHELELIERNVVPREGDFIEFGQVFFEITSVTEPQIVFGQINEKMMKKCVCVPSREGQFQAGGSANEHKDRSHPATPVISRYDPQL